ncbi:MAG: DNA starvation/stationary phase protection protein [Candidatus Midichloriaceae bacterium]
MSTHKNELSEKLLIILASLYSLGLKTQNYHWNITGENFYQYHKLLEKLYKDNLNSIDTIAEHIRLYKTKIPATLENFAKLSVIKGSKNDVSTHIMLNNLFLDNQLIVDTILHWIEVYEKDCKRTTVNLLDEILEEREEAMYILSSILEK